MQFVVIKNQPVQGITKSQKCTAVIAPIEQPLFQVIVN